MIWAQPATAERAQEVHDIGEAVEVAAEYSGEDPWRLAALVVRESGVRNDRVGKLGECGASQVIGRYVGMSCDELQDPLLGQLGVVRALDSWERDRPKEDAWACFASGNKCYAPKSMAKLNRIANELRRSVEE